MKRKVMVVAVAVFMIFTMSLLIGCEAGKINKAVQNANAQFASLRVSVNGENAEKLVLEMRTTLKAVGLPLNHIGLGDSEARKLIHNAYAREARIYWNDLKKCDKEKCTDFNRAEKNRIAIETKAFRAERSLQAIGINEKLMDKMVANVHLRAASWLTGHKYAEVNAIQKKSVKIKPVTTHKKKVKVAKSK